VQPSAVPQSVAEKQLCPPQALSPWVGGLLTAAGIALLLLFLWIAFGRRQQKYDAADKKAGAGPALLAGLPILAALGLALVPFAPDLCDGKWIPVDELAVALMVGGGFLGFLYGLPVVDPEALKKAAATAGTFTRPSTKLETVTDQLVVVATGGVITFALTEGGKFSEFFIWASGLPPGSASQLLGVGILLYFGPIGFVLAYSLTATVGALAFKEAQKALVEAATIVNTFPPFPDLPSEPSPEQIAAAKTIAACDYSSLTTSTDKAAWARAQTVLMNYPEARRAYAEVIAHDTRNASLLVDFAVTIYNDPTIDDIPHVVSLLNEAKAITGAQPPVLLQKRMLALQAVTGLYQPGGYERTIVVVNDWITGPTPTTDFARFYRACAFGQLYESCAPGASPVQGPYVMLGPEDERLLKSIVRSDVEITVAVAKERARNQVRMVIDPTSPLRIQPKDKFLQMLGADDPELCALVDIRTPPPPPQGPRPPRPTIAIPDPMVAPPGALADWIDLNCPT
jgi:hypothetical protein